MPRLRGMTESEHFVVASKENLVVLPGQGKNYLILYCSKFLGSGRRSVNLEKTRGQKITYPFRVAFTGSKIQAFMLVL